MAKSKATKVIGIHSGRQVTLAAYIKAWKIALNAPPKTVFKDSLTTWWSVSREEVLRQFSDGVHDRINRHLPWFGKGRKWSA